MASKLLTSIAFALLVGAALSLPVANNEEVAAKATDAAAAAAPEEAIFNYELPTETELNPADLDSQERQLTELQPPAIDSYVPFRVEEPTKKPRKGGKKYNPDEKWINKNAAEPRDASAEDNEERQYALLDFIIENLFLGIADQYNAQRRGISSPVAADDGQVLVLNKGEYIPSPQRRIDEPAAAGEDEQIVFQIRGHQGGFDTAKTASSE